tara:strand:+ start:1160 stop:1432 length:273 start_codon:yes stop_codon:yes gene_type:complete
VAAEELADLIGQEVVVDSVAPFVYLGTLKYVSDQTVVLRNVDVHDLRDSNTTRERYVLDARHDGIGANRKRVLIQRHQVVSISPLHDVLE